MSGPPRWRHTCDFCVFLGRYATDDLYFCPGATHQGLKVKPPAFAMRSGAMPLEQIHVLVDVARVLVRRQPWARFALDLAEKRGLLKEVA